MFACFYANGEYFRTFKRLKDAKKVCASCGVAKIYSFRADRCYWLGVDY